MPEDAIAPDTRNPESVADPKADLMERIIDGLRAVYDPEIPVNIFDLGLIYRIDVDDDGNAEVDMTLTAPNCPMAGELPRMVQEMTEATVGVTSCKVELVWEPPWTQDMMSDVAKLQLDMF